MKKIKEYRIRANLSQGQLAEKLSVKQSAVSQWERGFAYPEINTAKKLSDILNIPFDQIYDCPSRGGLFDLPVYSVIRSTGECILSTKEGSLLKVSEEELEMLLPRAEVKSRGLSSDKKSRIDPSWFFGFYNEAPALNHQIMPRSVNIIYRTDKIFEPHIHLVSIDGNDAAFIKLTKGESGIVALFDNDPVQCRVFHKSEIKDGKLRIHGVLLQSKRSFLY